MRTLSVFTFPSKSLSCSELSRVVHLALLFDRFRERLYEAGIDISKSATKIINPANSFEREVDAGS
jgi:hypothetical protein